MTKARLLVIDDEFGPRESLRFLFKDLYDVACVDSVDRGLEDFRQHLPDCVITDIKMPGKTGIEGLRAIRAIDPHVSIIMLTGFGTLETAQEAIRHGASDYVKKPFDTVEMRGTVESNVNKTRMRRGRQAAYEHLRAINEQLQSEISSKDHLAKLGQATTEFVHDIRNPLTVICGYVSLMMSNIKDGPAVEQGFLNAERTREYLEQMEKSVLRCQEMSRMWRDLSMDEGGGGRREPCSLLDVLREVCDVLKPLLREIHAGVDLVTPDGDFCVNGDNLQLYRAFQNLGSNAVQALPKDGSGRLLIRLSGDPRRVRVEMLDNGGGIPEEKLESVFLPYVSSRKMEGGMGIGLFITRKIIEHHGGRISLANRPEGGVAATVEFALDTAAG